MLVCPYELDVGVMRISMIRQFGLEKKKHKRKFNFQTFFYDMILILISKQIGRMWLIVVDQHAAPSLATLDQFHSL